MFVPPYTATADDLAIMARMPNLRVVQTLTAGVDNVLAALPDGVMLCNAAGVHDASTAELAVGLTIASLRHLDEFARAMPEGRWLYDRHEALADKRVLIVGFGSIGRAIARRLDGFECQVSCGGPHRAEVDGDRRPLDRRAARPAAGRRRRDPDRAADPRHPPDGRRRLPGPRCPTARCW